MADCSQCTITYPGPSAAYCGGSSTLYMFMAVLEVFLRKQCDIEDPCNHITSIKEPLDEYDFIVVGGGSAGSVVANRLSENPRWKVLVVEAGGNEPTLAQVPAMFLASQKTYIDWQYSPEPEERACLNLGKCAVARGKVIGGSSVLFGMIYERGNKKDYDDWEELGNYNWKYTDVLPYFKKSENNLQIDKVDKGYHATGGYLPVSYFNWQPPMSADILKAAQELGHKVGDINGAERTRFSVFQSTTRNGVRSSASRSFLRPVSHRPNLHILLNTTVTRVLISEAKRAYGVEIKSESGELVTIKAKREVAVCGGAYASPQILLLSGVGDKDELNDLGIPVVHHLPGVGKNFHTQISLSTKFFVGETSNSNNLNYATALQYLQSRDGPLSGRFAATGFLNSKYNNPEDDHPDIQLAFRGYLSACSNSGAIEEINPNYITISSYVLRPKSRGYVTLRDNVYSSKPKIVMNLLSDSHDAEIVVDGVYQAIELMKAKALESYNITMDPTPVPGCENKTFLTDDYFKCALSRSGSPAEHPVGTCKMGPSSDSSAVVDPELRVHGIRGLRVIDAAVMPNIISGYTFATTVMIGEKGADMIVKKWSLRL